MKNWTHCYGPTGTPVRYPRPVRISCRTCGPQIDARQRFAFSFTRMAGAFVTAALALSFALGVYLAAPANAGYYSQSYVEALTPGQYTGFH